MKSGRHHLGWCCPGATEGQLVGSVDTRLNVGRLLDQHHRGDLKNFLLRKQNGGCVKTLDVAFFRREHVIGKDALRELLHGFRRTAETAMDGVDGIVITERSGRPAFGIDWCAPLNSIPWLIFIMTTITPSAMA